MGFGEFERAEIEAKALMNKDIGSIESDHWSRY